jgi:hypothetical protein
MSYSLSNSEQHTYKCKTKKDMKKLKKATKQKFANDDEILKEFIFEVMS